MRAIYLETSTGIPPFSVNFPDTRMRFCRVCRSCRRHHPDSRRWRPHDSCSDGPIVHGMTAQQPRILKRLNVRKVAQCLGQQQQHGFRPFQFLGEYDVGQSQGQHLGVRAIGRDCRYQIGQREGCRAPKLDRRIDLVRDPGKTVVPAHPQQSAELLNEWCGDRTGSPWQQSHGQKQLSGRPRIVAGGRASNRSRVDRRGSYRRAIQRNTGSEGSVGFGDVAAARQRPTWQAGRPDRGR
jgi:hypothetical protein